MSTPALLELADERIETALKELADIQIETGYATLINSFSEPQRNTFICCDSMPNFLITNLLVHSY